MIKNNKIILATGGTGGHIFPAIALHDFLVDKGFKVYVIADSRFLKFRDYIGDNTSYEVICSDRLSGNMFKKLFGILKLLFGTVQAFFAILQFNPSAVVGFGGYPSFPTIVAAKILGKKIILHEQNTVMGNANKFLSRFSDIVASSFPSIKNLPKNVVVKHTGNFIRKRVVDSGVRPLPGMQKNAKIFFTIMGGSQGASKLSMVAPKAIGLFAKERGVAVKVFHQARPEDEKKVREQYKEFGVEAEIKSFFGDIEEKISDSHLVISRAGASTITDLIALGRAAIFSPIPYSFGNHQYYNAKFIADKKAGWLIEEKLFSSERLTQDLLKIFSDPAILNKYTHNMSQLKNDAFKNILPIIKNYCAK